MGKRLRSDSLFVRDDVKKFQNHRYLPFGMRRCGFIIYRYLLRKMRRRGLMQRRYPPWEGWYPKRPHQALLPAVWVGNLDVDAVRECFAPLRKYKDFFNREDNRDRIRFWQCRGEGG